MALSCRKLLNLTYAWLFDLIGGTPQWDKEYAHIFDPDKHEDFDYVDIPEVAESTGEFRPRLQMHGY